MNALKLYPKSIVALIILLSCLVGEQLFAEKSAEDIAAIGKAAVEGDPEAQSSLGTLYYSGEGISQDFEKALKWYRLAAEQEC